MFFIVLAIALSLRIYNWQAYHFGFDQVQILTNAEQILTGKLTLIGPRTGPANTFTGPAIYYLTAIILIFFNPIQAVVFVPLLLSVSTAFLIYYLVKIYLGKRAAIVATVIWSISPLLVYLDRIFWNPNLSLSAFALVVLPLFSNKKFLKRDLYFIALGSFLAYQAHFSAFLLFPMILIFVLINKRPKTIILASFGGLMLSLLPTLLFDFRHGFLNIRGIWSLITSETSSLNSSSYLQKLLKNLLINLDIFSRLIFYKTGSINRSLMGLGFLSLCFFLQYKREIKKFFKILFWPLLASILMSFYRGDVPEYYFIISLPAFLLILLEVSKKINKYLLLLLFLFFSISTSIFTKNLIDKQSVEINLGNSLAIKNEIVLIAQNKSIREIRYYLPHASDFGLKYLIEALNLSDDNNVDDDVEVEIVYPANESPNTIFSSGKLGIVLKNYNFTN